MCIKLRPIKVINTTALKVIALLLCRYTTMCLYYYELCRYTTVYLLCKYTTIYYVGNKTYHLTLFCTFVKKMGQSRPIFVYFRFRYFLHTISIIQIE